MRHSAVAVPPLLPSVSKQTAAHLVIVVFLLLLICAGIKQSSVIFVCVCNIVQRTCKENDTQTQQVNDTQTRDENDTQTQDENDLQTRDENDMQTQDENGLQTRDENDTQTQDENDLQTQDENGVQTQDEIDTQIQDENDLQTRDENDMQTLDKNDTQTQDEIDTQIQDENDTQTQDENDLRTRDENTQTQDENDLQTQDENDMQTRDENDTQTQDEIDTQTRDENDTQTQDEIDTQTRDENDTQTQDEYDTQTQYDNGTHIAKLQDRAEVAANRRIKKASRSELLTYPRLQRFNRKEIRQHPDDLQDNIMAAFFDEEQVGGKGKTYGLIHRLTSFHSRALRRVSALTTHTVAMLKRPMKPPAEISSNRAVSSQQLSGLSSELDRLRTFSSYVPPAGIFVLPLAASGFFLSAAFQNPCNNNDSDRPPSQATVECAFCHVVVILSRFQGRQAASLHAELSPGCRFLRGDNVGNVSVADVGEVSSADFFQKYSLPVVLPSPGTQIPQDTSSTNRQPRLHATNSLAPSTDTSTRTGSQLAVSQQAVSQTAVSQQAGRQTAISQQAGSQTANSQQAGSQLAGSRTAVSQQAGSQTAVSQQVGSQLAGSRTAVSQQAGSQTAVSQQAGSQTAVSQQAGSQTAAVNPVPLQTVSGGTARAAPPSSSSRILPGVGGQSASTSAETDGDSGGSSYSERQMVTYEQLGIYSQQPKRPDMAVTQVRINTYDQWPHRGTHPPEEMAAAGFYFTGHEDLVRCFHCKQGLKAWDPLDRPWIEHCRWFPQCPFIKLCKGRKFVQAVQNLDDPNNRPTITDEDVLREVRRLEQLEVRNLGHRMLFLNDQPEEPSSGDPNHEALARVGFHVNADVIEASPQELADQLRADNDQLANSMLCKMCHNHDTQVLFLPCGHLVACAQCAPAIRNCAICRQLVKGYVRVRFGEKRDSEELLEYQESTQQSTGDT